MDDSQVIINGTNQRKEQTQPIPIFKKKEKKVLLSTELDLFIDSALR